MKNKKLLWGLIPVIAFVLASCGPTAHIEKADFVNFDKYKTFAWADRKDRSRDDIRENRIKSAISKELSETKGWNENNSRPDVLLSYDMLVERASKTQSDPVYTNSFTRTFYNPYNRRFYNVYYPSRFVGYDQYSVPTTEGTITITLTDAKTEKMVMQGWATEELNSRKMSADEIDKVVKAIFRKFDVAMK